MKLEKPLGRWCKRGANLDQDWLAYFDHNDYALYSKTTQGYTKYSRSKSVGNIFRYPETTIWTPATRSVPVKTTTQDGPETW
eukprot:3830425-Ditylum_brightwellii.AAC.1